MTIAATHTLLDNLGFGRVIWIDDFFENSVDRIRGSLMRDPAPLVGLNLTGFEDAVTFSTDVENIDRYESELINALSSAKEADLVALNAAIRDRAARQENEKSDVPSPEKDLPSDTILAACNILRVHDADRLGFEAGMSWLENLEADAEHGIAFVVDLQDAFQAEGIGEAAGINILKKLYARERSETVFVLTHETDVSAEATKEAEIAEQLADEAVSKPLPCVISKERISVNTEAELSKGIQIALKRASLRQEIFRVGQVAERQAALAIATARSAMCTIPPEELDGFFIKRAIKDGASDLHMIERIFSAQVSGKIRNMFVENEQVKDSVRRMRLLRDVPLQAPNIAYHPVITKFRQDEAWYAQNFLNAGFSPLSQGDVFQTLDADRRTFILLGQLCDVTLRDSGSRDAFVSDLVQFKPVPVPGDSLKALDLRVGSDGGYIRFDFRKTSPARLDILDLASMNKDGQVRISSDQEPEIGVLPGQAKGLLKTMKQLKTVLGNEDGKPEEIVRANARCQLTMQIDNPFNNIAKPSPKTKDGVTVLSWNLVRTGRLCSPYIDQLMDRQLTLLSRRALDIDYLPKAPPST